MRRHVLVHSLATVAMASCAGSPPAADPGLRGELPIVAARRLHVDPGAADLGPSPMPHITNWEIPASSWPAEGARFASEEAAFAAARAWLASHVENWKNLTMTFDTYNPASNRVWWEQTFLGMPTGRTGWIEFRSTTPVQASAECYEFAPVPGSTQKLVDAGTAVAAWKQAAINLGEDLATFAAREHLALLPAPHLELVVSLGADEQEIGGVRYTRAFRPAWILDEGRKLGVDAHTGTPWYEFDSNTFSAKPLAGPGASSGPPVATGPPLPLLECTPRKPIRDADSFEGEGMDVRFPKERRKPQPPAQPPFATDAVAIEAATKWIAEHFGPLPANTKLTPTRVLHSASGREQPAYDWDQGHTITFQQEYLGTPTHLRSIVYLVGKSVGQASVNIATIEPVPDSARPTITEAEAVKALLRMAEARGATAESLAEWQKRVQPRLEYVWSLEHNESLDLKSRIYAPTWVLVPGEPLMVDAHTGRVWIDD